MNNSSYYVLLFEVPEVLHVSNLFLRYFSVSFPAFLVHKEITDTPLGFIRSFCDKFACSFCACSSLTRFSPKNKVHARLITGSKLAGGGSLFMQKLFVTCMFVLTLHTRFLKQIQMNRKWDGRPNELRVYLFSCWSETSLVTQTRQSFFLLLVFLIISCSSCWLIKRCRIVHFWCFLPIWTLRLRTCCGWWWY